MPPWKPNRRTGWSSTAEQTVHRFTQIIRTVMELVPGGVIRYRKTAYTDDTNVGFWLGVDADGLARFNIGGPARYLKWTGSDLVVAGAIATSGIRLDDNGITLIADEQDIDALAWKNTAGQQAGFVNGFASTTDAKMALVAYSGRDVVHTLYLGAKSYTESGIVITRYPAATAFLSNIGFYLNNTLEATITPGTLQTQDLRYTSNLRPYRNSTAYTAYAFVPLTTPLGSDDWLGQRRSSASKTLLDLSAVFGVPAGVKAVLMSVLLADSGAAAAGTFLGAVLGPTNTLLAGAFCQCHGVADDTLICHQVTVPCDANGDIYYQLIASDTETLAVSLQVWGYYI